MHIQEQPMRKYAWYLRPLFWKQQLTYGKVLNSSLAWGRRPRLFIAVSRLYGTLVGARSLLSKELRTLLMVRVSQLNDCAFCVDVNSAALAKKTGSLDKVNALATWPRSNLFNERERTALEYAETMTVTGRKVTAEQIKALRGYFSENAVVEMTAVIAYQNMSSKFNAALDVAPQGFCRLPTPSRK